MLIYVTGGLALTKISFSQSYTDNIHFNTSTGGSVNASMSRTKAGWVIGGGFEHAFAAHWSLKAEYLYVRFDNLNASGRLADSFTPSFWGLFRLLKQFEPSCI
jgi:outer membrane immunogenic protein